MDKEFTTSLISILELRLWRITYLYSPTDGLIYFYGLSGTLYKSTFKSLEELKNNKVLVENFIECIRREVA